MRALCGLQAHYQSVLLLLGCNVDVIAAQMVPGSSVVRRHFPDKRVVLGRTEATLCRLVMVSGAALSTFFSGSDPRLGLEVASSEVTRLLWAGVFVCLLQKRGRALLLDNLVYNILRDGLCILTLYLCTHVE